ncbi:MAG: ParB/RepB/Spo0J family partition protein [Chitinispirillia bacterium]|nr:ParB/RepB/Spo0J family partition protein [Chitinispirillia bacterium]
MAKKKTSTGIGKLNPAIVKAIQAGEKRRVADVPEDRAGNGKPAARKAAKNKPAEAVPDALPPAQVGYKWRFDEAVPLSLIRVVKNSRRGRITPESDPKVLELADDIERTGLQAPLLLREVTGQDTFDVIAGHRRFFALEIVRSRNPERSAAMSRIFTGLTDDQVMDMQTAENIHRKDLLPTEEAEIYRRLHDDRGCKVEEIALRVGKSPKHISRYLRLLSLPENLLEQIDDGTLSLTKAQILCSMPDSVLKEFAAGEYAWMLRGGYNAKQFADELTERFFGSLNDDDLPFDRKMKYVDPETKKVYPPCAKCQYKDQIDLFREYAADGTCPNKECFDTKGNIACALESAERHENAAAAELAEEYPTGNTGGSSLMSPKEMKAWEAERVRRNEEGAAEQAERRKARMDQNIRRTDYYVGELLQRSFSPVAVHDFMFPWNKIAVEDDDGELESAVNALFTKYINKRISQLKAGCSHGDFFKAFLIASIFEADDFDTNDLAEFIGCEVFPEDKAEEEDAEDDDSEDGGDYDVAEDLEEAPYGDEDDVEESAEG